MGEVVGGGSLLFRRSARGKGSVYPTRILQRSCGDERTHADALPLGSQRDFLLLLLGEVGCDGGAHDDISQLPSCTR